MKLPKFKEVISLFKNENNQEVSVQPKSVVYQDADIVYGHNYPIVTRSWDGEKNLGELGVVVKNVPNYEKLRLRSYDAYATIDIVKIIAEKFFYWTVGSGLKLQAEPNRVVLETEGINNSTEFYTKFQKNVESRFMIYANSKKCDYLEEKNLHQLAMDFYQGSFLGGDNLVIARFGDNGPNFQFVSGEHIKTPSLDSGFIADAENKGNYIKHGIEIDKKGKHVAYYVCVKNKDSFDTFERIDAIGSKSKKRLAWLISGNKISPDHLRSVPAMSQSLEKINKLDRYVEAAVTKAEQGANVVHVIKHKEFSSGESPLQQEIQKKRGDQVTGGLTEEERMKLGDGLANRVSQQTAGLAYNMPIGAEMESFQSSIETNFGDFHSTVFKSISAGVNLPPEVAMQEYNSNYSASRAAINSFGYTITVNRARFANDFYIPFFKLWLEYEILTKKIEAPGYIENMDNFMVTESYTQCRFMGKNMPHIDPLKEIKAIREMLGINGAVPLISREQATEMLGAGQWDENFMKSLEEANLIPKEENDDSSDVSNDDSKNLNNN